MQERAHRRRLVGVVRGFIRIEIHQIKKFLRHRHGIIKMIDFALATTLGTYCVVQSVQIAFKFASLNIETLFAKGISRLLYSTDVDSSKQGRNAMLQDVYGGCIYCWPLVGAVWRNWTRIEL